MPTCQYTDTLLQLDISIQIHDLTDDVLMYCTRPSGHLVLKGSGPRILPFYLGYIFLKFGCHNFSRGERVKGDK